MRGARWRPHGNRQRYCCRESVMGKRKEPQDAQLVVPSPSPCHEFIRRRSHVVATIRTVFLNSGCGVFTHSDLVSSTAFSFVVRRRSTDHRRQESSDREFCVPCRGRFHYVGGQKRRA